MMTKRKMALWLTARECACSAASVEQGEHSGKRFREYMRMKRDELLEKCRKTPVKDRRVRVRGNEEILVGSWVIIWRGSPARKFAARIIDFNKDIMDGQRVVYELANGERYTAKFDPTQEVKFFWDKGPAVQEENKCKREMGL